MSAVAVQVTVALSAEPTAYSHEPKKAMPEPPTLPVGATAALVSLVQVGPAGQLGVGSIHTAGGRFPLAGV